MTDLGNDMAAPATTVAPEAAPADQARRYARLRRRLGLAGWLVDAALLVALLAAGWSEALRDAAFAASPRPGVALLVYLLMMGAIFEAVSLPFDYYAGFVLERRFGLSRMTLPMWLKDLAKSLAIGAFFGIGAAELLYWALARHPHRWWLAWWLWGAAVVIAFVVLLALLSPVVLFPLFFKFRPIADQDLAGRLRRLAAAAGAPAEMVLEWKLGEKTRKANAAVAGWGITRRILLSDTLIERFTPEEIETVVAHELGHKVHHDIPVSIVVDSGLALGSLWLVNRVLVWATPQFGFHGLADFANLPLVLLVLAAVSLMALPATNGYSRWRERRADGFALRVTHNQEAFIRAMRKLAEQNLAELEPSRLVEFLFHGHPSPAKRIAYAEQAKP